MQEFFRFSSQLLNRLFNSGQISTGDDNLPVLFRLCDRLGAFLLSEQEVQSW